MILLDTHALIWLDQGSSKLGQIARRNADEALQERRLFVSAISFWEVAMLGQKDRVTLGRKLDYWRQSLVDLGLQEIAVDGSIGLAAGSLEDLHGDPADRIIVATALHGGASLITADERILSWSGGLSCQDARA